MILAEIKFEKKSIIFGKEIPFTACITEIETAKKGRYRQIHSDYQPDYEILYPYRYDTQIGLNECVRILKDLGYSLIEARI